MNYPINTALTEKLAELTNCLFWVSESEFPWQVFAWETPGPINLQDLLKLTYHIPGERVEKITLDDFFAPILYAERIDSKWENLQQLRYKILYNFLKYSLSDIQVYRVGKGHIYLYIIGITRDDNLAGISTQLIENETLSLQGYPS